MIEQYFKYYVHQIDKFYTEHQTLVEPSLHHLALMPISKYRETGASVQLPEQLVENLGEGGQHLEVRMSYPHFEIILNPE